jgi:hypothetical protein
MVFSIHKCHFRLFSAHPAGAELSSAFLPLFFLTRRCKNASLPCLTYVERPQRAQEEDSKAARQEAKTAGKYKKDTK